MALNREAILSAPDPLPREEISVPEWGGTVWVRTLTASERDQLEVEWERTKRVHFRARLCKYAACAEDGTPLFRETDIPVLGAKSVTAVARIFDTALRLNRFTPQDVEDLEKNSASGPPEDS